MSLQNEQIFQWLSEYAYQPNLVYLGAFVLMMASGFGFPLPEEVSIISVGILAYMGAHPELFPPPMPGAAVVNGYEAAAVLTFSVFLADMMVFVIGRTAGRKIMNRPSFQRFFGGRTMDRVNNFVKRYGSWAAFLFRFAPGIRFPGHLFLGMTHFPWLRFFLIDGFAVLISVPTQVLLVFFFGEAILTLIRKFKIILAVVLGSLILFFIMKKYLQMRKNRLSAGSQA